MKLLSFRIGGEATFGAVVDGRALDLKKSLNGKYADLLAALQAGALVELEEAVSRGGLTYDLNEIEFLPVIPNPPKIICIGINYETHRSETGKDLSAKPWVFGRFANSQVGHGQPLIAPLESTRFDYEGEIAVIIGKRGRRISQAASWEHIAGYAPYNDGSVRDWQRHTPQWVPGKNFVGSGGFGPWMATRGEIADNAELHLSTRVNGRELQRATSHEMIQSIPQIIEYCSTFTELEPGDVIVTGTPGGVGARQEPPLFMKDGDIVEIEIAEIGVLRNPVKQEAPAA
ncbi:fumarylacetoacetate hydrolase family protein [Herbaspirillum seropedicae]|uniref:fumarylacetoacetate hydrolase family protein n=1 Tax=Herbaspirillum seropedicae TaxID=964 RepID=UPI000847D9A0|nr:fumarylacetoacetate hydrolase family protein [Herbaspirillum seropedicae]AON53729.1 fumarylacetoacetate (FAA) hydrolase family protein [Herbaspirillum seropedicae]